MNRLPTAQFSGIRALTFDFYNTLVHHREGRGRGSVLIEYLRAHGMECDPWEHQVLYDIFTPATGRYSPHLPEPEKRRYIRGLADCLFRRLRVRAPSGAVEEHAESLWKILGPAAFTTYPEVLDVLHDLRAAGYKMAVVSNWQFGLDSFCMDLGLADAFDHILASAEIGSAKPDPGIFLEACRRLSLPPRRVLHIGDSPLEDLHGARAAGLEAVCIDREGAAPSADPAIPSLRALGRLLGIRDVSSGDD